MNEVRKPIKKGNNSWKPAGITDVTDKEPGYRYRFCNKEPENLAKKVAEGWEPVSGLQADKAKLVQNTNEAKPLTSVHERRDTILYRMPEEIAQSRDDYYNKITARSESVLTAHIKQELRKEGAEAHGKITISSRKGEQTME